MIPYGRQDVREEDIKEVAAILRSDWLTQGPMVPRFEEAVAAYCGAARAVAVNSGTSALHLACLALGLGPGDRLWTSPLTFVASANCARYCGAEVDFVDIDPATGNMSVPALAEKLERAEKAGRLPKIVVPVHFAGLPCPMAQIHALAERHGFAIIEDACHGLGARYQGEPIGNGRFSDITVMSFHPVKPITTGEGGIALSKDAQLAEKLRRLRSHGIVREQDALAREGPWYYEQIALGYNFRMTDFQAALGSSQLSRLDQYLTRRRELAERYDALLADLPLRLPARASQAESAWHLYVVRLQDAARRRAVFERLRDAGIGVQVHYIPVHWQPYYQALGFRRGDFPEAERFYASAMSLPLFPGLIDAEQQRVATVLREVLG